MTQPHCRKHLPESGDNSNRLIVDSSSIKSLRGKFFYFLFSLQKTIEMSHKM